MNSRRLWNSHQRHLLLRAKASRDILKFIVSETAFPGVFKRYFPPRMPCCFVRILTGNNAITMSQGFHDITQFECFTDVNLFKYTVCVQCLSKLGNGCFTIFYSMVLTLC